MSDMDEVLVCPSCSAEYERDSYCGECGYGREVGELVEATEAPKPEPVFARETTPRSLPVHEAAWCPYCVVWLGTFPSRAEARAYERSLDDHPFEFCTRRQASLNGSEEWRLRHEAGKRGSLASAKPGGPRVPPTEARA